MGVNLGYISRLATRGRGRQNLADPGSKPPTAPTKPSETQTERIARRFYCALVLHDLIQEVASSSISPYQNSLSCRFCIQLPHLLKRATTCCAMFFGSQAMLLLLL